MNLIYMCVFHQQSYIQLLKLLITSINTHSTINKETTHILIVTCTAFKRLIQKELEPYDLPIDYFIIEINTLFQAGCARLDIFKYERISQYDTILYLDTDILINSDINVLFAVDLSTEKLYALKEGEIGQGGHGMEFFDFTKYDVKLSAFTSGILLFKNSDTIKELFNTILLHIDEYIYKGKNKIPGCLDQPFIVYNAISQNKYDNQLLCAYAENNPTCVTPGKIVYHFPGGPGNYKSKYDKMANFLNKNVPCIIDAILKNKLSQVSKERLTNLMNQCTRFRDTNYSFVECGVAKGGCLAMMKYSAGKNNLIFGFDSFDGMPAITDKDLGDYNKSCPKKWVNVKLCDSITEVSNTFAKLNISMDNVTLVKGYFNDTLTIKENVDSLGEIAVLRLDGDWYASTKICLDTLYDKVVVGGVIIIDDYGHFIGAKRATDEFRLQRNITSPLLKTDYTEFYWIKCETVKKHCIQVGAHIGNTVNDPLFRNINSELDYILIEPVPYLYNTLVDNYKQYKNVTCLNIAISNTIGTLELYVPSQSNDFSKMVSWASQLASINSNHIHTFVPECIVEKIVVKCTTLNKLIEDYSIKCIDTLIIDTEGHDFDILMDLNLSVKPKTIIFENKHMDGPKRKFDLSNAPNYHELIKHFTSHGYTVDKQTSEDTHLKYLKTVNIHEDIWTCSDEMRRDIAEFFKDKSAYTIAEIGAHKGYTTRVLSHLFSKVYAVDNSVDWTAFNKKYNKDRTNIEYCMLDIYKDDWAKLPTTIDISFIDARHTYEACKSDICNSIKQFTHLKYIIFDDYGVWEGVKRVVDEMIKENTLVFERFIGLTNVPGPKGIVKNTHEGILCRLTK